MDHINQATKRLVIAGQRLTHRLHRGEKVTPTTSTAETSEPVDLATLPEILNFKEEDFPLLSETHERIVEAAQAGGLKQAEAASSTYQELAETHVKEQLASGSHPEPIKQTMYSKARCGILVKIAGIWHEAGKFGQCSKSLDRAIAYARNMRWESIATALEIEKDKLQAAAG